MMHVQLCSWTYGSPRVFEKYCIRAASDAHALLGVISLFHPSARCSTEWIVILYHNFGIFRPILTYRGSWETYSDRKADEVMFG